MAQVKGFAGVRAQEVLQSLAQVQPDFGSLADLGELVSRSSRGIKMGKQDSKMNKDGQSLYWSLLITIRS